MPALGIPAYMQTTSFSQSLKTGQIRLVKLNRAERKRLVQKSAKRSLSVFLTVLGIAAPFWIISILVTTRRLHDRNKSGFWQLLLYLPLPAILIPMIFVALGFELSAFLQHASSNILIGCTLISIIASIRYAIELGFFGPRGGSPNKYGIDPRTN